MGRSPFKSVRVKLALVKLPVKPDGSSGVKWFNLSLTVQWLNSNPRLIWNLLEIEEPSNHLDPRESQS